MSHVTFGRKSGITSGRSYSQTNCTSSLSAEKSPSCLLALRLLIFIVKTQHNVFTCKRWSSTTDRLSCFVFVVQTCKWVLYTVNSSRDAKDMTCHARRGHDYGIWTLVSFIIWILVSLSWYFTNRGTTPWFQRNLFHLSWKVSLGNNLPHKVYFLFKRRDSWRD